MFVNSNDTLQVKVAAIYDAVYMVARAIDEDTAKPDAVSLDRDEFWSRGRSLYGNLNTVSVSNNFYLKHTHSIGLIFISF